MNTFEFIWCSKNDVRVRAMFDKMVFDPSLLHTYWCLKSNWVSFADTEKLSCNNGNCKCRLSSWSSWSACCKSGGGTISDVSTKTRRILDSEPCDNNDRLEQSKYCPTCPCVYESEFTCHKSGGQCIRKSWVCDGDKDCENGEDEEIDRCHPVCFDYATDYRPGAIDIDTTYYSFLTFKFIKSPEECQSFCQQNPQCNFFTYNLDKRACIRKKSKGSPSKIERAVSGPRNCSYGIYWPI